MHKNSTSTSGSLVWLLFIATSLPGVAQEQQPAPQNNPELVPQTASGFGYGGMGVFGADGHWFAAASSQSDVVLYDLTGGRVSHRFNNTEGTARLAAHPTRNLLAIDTDEGTHSALQIYDVDHGTVLWKVSTRTACVAVHFSQDGSKLLAACSGADALLRWDVLSGAVVTGPGLPEGYVPAVATNPTALFSEDGRWMLSSPPMPAYAGPGGKPSRNPFTAIKQYQQMMGAMKNRAIVDTETGEIVAHVTAFMVMAISAKAHTVMSIGLPMTGTPALVLTDVLNPSVKPVQINAPYAVNIQTTQDGSHYALFSPFGASLVDAATGTALRPNWNHVPYMGIGSLAADGDTTAFMQGGSLTLFRFSQPGSGTILGSPQQANLLTMDTSGKVGSGAADTAGTPQPAVPASKPSPATTVEVSSTKIPGATDSLKSMIPIYGSIWDSRRRKAKDKAAKQQQQEMGEQETQMARMESDGSSNIKTAVLRFGGPIMLPPEPVFLNSGSLMAVRTADSTWGMWDVATGNHVATQSSSLVDMDKVTDLPTWLNQSNLTDLEKSLGIHGPDIGAGRNENTIALAHSPDGLQTFIHPIPGSSIPDGKTDYTRSQESGSLVSPAGYGLRVVDAAGRTMFDIPEVLGDASHLWVAPGGHVLVGADRSLTLGFWDRGTGKRLGSLTAFQEGEWLLTTPEGLFDGSPRGWGQIAWRDPNGGNATLPGEAFFSEFYYPGLLAELLEGHVPQPPRSMANIDRSQPLVQLISTETRTSQKTAAISLTVKEASGGGQPGGVRDVRLFRNDVLIHAWRGEQHLENGQTTLSAIVPLVAGDNRFVAYAFNRDNVKSLDGKLTIQSTRSAGSRTAYIVSIGVNRYSNTEFNLNFAEPDATHFSSMLGESLKSLKQYDRLVQVNLLDEDATKENIRRTLDVLSGRVRPSQLPASLAGLQQTGPEDTVIIYFAGHGIAYEDHFYLIPHDLGYNGTKADLSASLNNVLAHGLSDLELEQGLDPLDAANIVLIIDACNSGKALDAEDARRGPMNSKGLAQLAYEKGMYVLTASQAYQAALESSKLGHGYLTYALTDEGLKTPQADTSPIDGKVSVVEWFQFASRRVPQMQNEALKAAANSGDRNLVFEMAKDKTDRKATVNRLQTPRLYYRREQQGPEPIVSDLAAKATAD